MLFNKKGFEPKGFDYVPRFWDPVKEEFEKRVSDAKERYHGEKTKSKHRVVRFDFRDDTKFVTGGAQMDKFDRNYGKVSPFRLLVVLGVLIGLLWVTFVL